MKYRFSSAQGSENILKSRFSSSKKYVGLVPVQTRPSIGGFQRKNRAQLHNRFVVP